MAPSLFKVQSISDKSLVTAIIKDWIGRVDRRRSMVLVRRVLARSSSAARACELRMMILNLPPEGWVRQALRWDAVLPPNAKRSDVRRILEVASEHGDELMTLWRAARG